MLPSKRERPTSPDVETMNNQPTILLASVLISAASSGFSQGTFDNLNFEQANISDPISITGWTLYSGTVAYNDVSLGGAAISIHSTQSLFFQPLQGNSSVFIQGSSAGPPTSAAIGQSGQIPLNCLSLRFWADPRSNLQVTFGGQLIPMFKLSSTPNYDVFGGDISTFAGQSAELRFTGLANSGGYFDNIEFSTEPIPEPSILALLCLGGYFALVKRQPERWVV
jgi:hypothetical protein